MNAHFLSPKVQVRADANGWGSFAVLPIVAGETVAAFGGRCMTRCQLDELSVNDQVRSVQIDNDLYLVAPIVETADLPGDVISHSCAPNCGIAGGVLVVAMRDIEAGETLSFDYAMCTGSNVNEFECGCGATVCRRKVTGNDWMLPELQIAYRSYFSPFLTKRIASLVSSGAERRPFAY